MIEKISTPNAPKAIGPYSQAVKVDNMLFTSGQIPLDPETGLVVGDSITEQTEQVMKNLAAVLEAAGASFDNAVKTTCFLSTSATSPRSTKFTQNISPPPPPAPAFQ